MSFIRTDMAPPKFVGGSMIHRAKQPVAPQMGAVRLLGTEESVIVVCKPACLDEWGSTIQAMTCVEKRRSAYSTFTSTRTSGSPLRL
jgi:hypothetical protein